MSGTIDGLLDIYWAEFEAWLSQGTRKFQDLDNETARVFIPRRLMELAENPEMLKVFVTREYHDPKKPFPLRDSLVILIYETLPRMLSDPTKFREYMERRKAEKVSILPNTQADVPEGIDYQHVYHAREIDAGLLTFNDKAFLQYYANVYVDAPNVFETRNLNDRPELHRRGIGASFYERLEAVLRHMGFKYITGDVVSSHRAFFGKTRRNLSDLSAEELRKMPLLYQKHGFAPYKHIMIKSL